MRSPHFEDVYRATVSKDPISRITDKVLGEMAEWQNRPLGQIVGGAGWDRTSDLPRVRRQ